VVVAVNKFDPHIASIVVNPAARLLACPLALMVATPGVEEIQVTVLVTSIELPSL